MITIPSKTWTNNRRNNVTTARSPDLGNPYPPVSQLNCLSFTARYCTMGDKTNNRIVLHLSVTVLLYHQPTAYFHCYGNGNNVMFL